jgi:hypothetical protein
MLNFPFTSALLMSLWRWELCKYANFGRIDWQKKGEVRRMGGGWERSIKKACA